MPKRKADIIAAATVVLAGLVVFVSSSSDAPSTGVRGAGEAVQQMQDGDMITVDGDTFVLEVRN
ncbi:hypothetical protein [Streptomyces natalensis]|uniref:Uncharacterized protein n=1 Tax=Streptomyces natalensis ATCC 27448 TaxID=1240678 RepID=A0A0D7CF07_9ACTN|nr:hypothetical protein [Streptomyces natalensis]KIZ14814.1 hypothetical protein SNA_30535 [Streptomyces natalensis ATCC 27448]